MPLDTIYLTRHGHRLNWTIDYKTGTYHAQFPTPTGNPADPTLTSHGVRQSHELAAHLTSDSVHPKPFRVYCSPFYRCLQTIQPSVEALKALHQRTCSTESTSTTTTTPTPTPTDSTIEPQADFDVRIENGLGEWFGHTTFFEHPQPAPHSILATHFPTLLPLPPATAPPPPRVQDHGGNPFSSSQPPPAPHVLPSPTGETIAQLHDRVATALAGICADVDAEIAALEAAQPAHEPRTSKAILICSHAAPLIAMGRALTGHMPADPNTEDFAVFTAGLSTFRRRSRSRESGEPGGASPGPGEHAEVSSLARGTKVLRAGTTVPEWRGAKVSRVAGIVHFDGEEGFDTGPMAPEEAAPTSSLDTMAADGAGERGMKL